MGGFGTTGLRRLLARVALSAVVGVFVFNLVAPSREDVERAAVYSGIGAVGKRYATLAEQVDLHRNGHYLVRADGTSFVVDTREDIGTRLLLADLAFVRATLGLAPLEKADAFRLQGYVIASGAVLFVVLGAPLSAVAASCLLLVLFVLPDVTGVAERSWPQIAAVAFSFALLHVTARDVCEGLSWRKLLRLATLGFYVGALGVFRIEASYVPLAPFAGLLALHTLVLGGWLLKAVRSDGVQSTFRRCLAFVRRRAGEKTGPRPAVPGLRELGACAAVIAGVLAASPASTLNLIFFELIEGVEHRPEIGQHLFWHPLFIGLGAQVHFPENLYWSDDLGRLEARRANDSFVDFDRASEAAARERYLEILVRNTPFVTQVYLQKLRLLVDGLVPGASTAAILPCIAIGCLVVFLGIARRHRDGSVWGPTLAIGSLGIMAITAMPGLVALVRYAVAFPVAIAGTVLFAMVVSGERIFAGEEPIAEEEQRWRGIGRSALVATLILGSALLLLLLRVSLVESHRQRLTERFMTLSLSFDELLEEYHADAVAAFNVLPDGQRSQIAADLMRQHGKRFDADVRRAIGASNPEVLLARRTDKTLYLLVKLNARSLRTKVIPVRLDFYNAESMNDLIFLPRGTRPGVWLFSVRAPRDTVARCTIGEIQPFRHLLYTEPVDL